MNNFMLQNYIESGNNFNFGDSKPKKNQKPGAQELEFQIGTVFNEICQILEDNNIFFQLPEESTKTSDRINLFKDIVEQLIEQKAPPAKREQNDEINNQSNIITCIDCQNYEANLQKLEQEVRQHIRLEQQLKIFQDTQDQKLEELKKQKKTYDKKIDSLNKQLQDSKTFINTINEKVVKLEAENDHYKKELRDFKRSVSTHQEPLTTKRDSHKQSTYAYESKQNKIDWAHRNVSIKKEDNKDKHIERKSIEKRGDSAEKNWRMSANSKSNKMISVMNEKLIHEKTKEERKKVIQSKFDYRR